MSLMSAEKDRLRLEGWDDRRIADLDMIIGMREKRGISPIRRHEIDKHLVQVGHQPSDHLRWQVEQVLYPAYRDAYLDAEIQLQYPPEYGQAADRREANTQTANVEPQMSSIPDRWRTCTPTEAAERMIKETPRLFSHRQDGKRATEAVGEQTLRQIRWAASLLEKSLPLHTPLWKVTKADIWKLDWWFEQLSVHFGKSPHHQDVACTLAVAAAEAIKNLSNGKLSEEGVGLSTGTANKHYNKLGQIHKFMCGQVDAATPIDFGALTASINQDKREARKRYTREQGEAIFQLPPWTGCKGQNNRLQTGSKVIHDGLFFVMLLG